LATLVHTAGGYAALVDDANVYTSLNADTADSLKDVSNWFRGPDAIGPRRACGKDPSDLFVSNVRSIDIGKCEPRIANPLL
jgi:hypothetical protein